MMRPFAEVEWGLLRDILWWVTVADVLVTLERKLVDPFYWWNPQWMWYLFWPILYLCYIPALGQALYDGVTAWTLGPLDAFYARIPFLQGDRE